MLGVALPLGRGLSLAGAASGPFGRLVGDENTGSATTTQALATIGGRYELELRGGISPFVVLATGVHYIRAEGTPALEKAPIPMSASAIAPLFAFGAGVSVWFRRWLAATVQVEEFYTQPMTDVVISGVVVGQRGRTVVAGPGRAAGVARRALTQRLSQRLRRHRRRDGLVQAAAGIVGAEDEAEEIVEGSTRGRIGEQPARGEIGGDQVAAEHGDAIAREHAGTDRGDCPE